MFRTRAKRTQKSTQAYLDIAAIKDGVVVLQNGGLRAVLAVTSVNFALKSPEEQEDIVLRYQGFLNSLHYPLQIMMQSRKLDLADYLTRLRQRGETEGNEQIKNQIAAYTDFMEKLLAVANIMDKRFYVVVSYDPESLKSKSFLDKLLHPSKQITISMTEQEFQRYTTQLNERVNLIGSGLASIGLKAAMLTTKQLIELYYSTYNPEEAVKERLVDINQLSQQYIVQPKAPAAEGATNG
ncbi:hypothetical protein HYW32_02440 [Candidatus Berkelbacteria bacterium]|nr:hypothetical protein [Candidatus Berkelbacteria bacterium]